VNSERRKKLPSEAAPDEFNGRLVLICCRRESNVVCAEELDSYDVPGTVEDDVVYLRRHDLQDDGTVSVQSRRGRKQLAVVTASAQNVIEGVKQRVAEVIELCHRFVLLPSLLHVGVNSKMHVFEIRISGIDDVVEQGHGHALPGPVVLTLDGPATLLRTTL